MAELASRAVVSSLLGLLQNEVLLLSRVGSDVEFIKAEMESMHSFLEHLARTAPPAGGHNNQVRTWMKQVRDLAHDCSSCIDLYLRRGDPEIYRARGGRWHYLWWAKWLVQKMVAQHDAAIRLRVLKERAHDVGQRRLRYGVELPGGEARGSSAMPSVPSLSREAAAEEEDYEDDQNQSAGVADGSDPRQRALESCDLEEYCAEKLANWLDEQARTKMEVAIHIPTIAIVAPDDAENAGAIAHESLALATTHFSCKVWINLRAVHYPWDLPLLPLHILSYILRECQQQHGIVQDKAGERDPRRQAFHYIKSLQDYEIRNTLTSFEEIIGKIQDIEEKIGAVDRNKIIEETKSLSRVDKHLGMLLHAMRLMQDMPDMDVPLSMDGALQETASRLKTHMEAGMSEPKIRLDGSQYKYILEKVFLGSKTSQPQAQEAATSAATTLHEDHIKREVLHMQKLLEGNYHYQRLGSRDQVSKDIDAAAVTRETKVKMKEISAINNGIKEKMNGIMGEIRFQLIIRGIVDKIKIYLECRKTLIILQDDEDYISQWEDIRYALNLLGCTAGSAVIVLTKNSQKAKEFCYPRGEPITCSLVGLYHDMVLQLTKKSEHNPQILRDILDRCYPDEFCMKIFAHALYVNPNRSYEELQKLYEDMQKTSGSKAKKMLQFSYEDLTREYKTCLLYLAIFPQGHNIRRSTLIGRWITEGLITKQDRSTEVIHAERCFDTLIKRGLVLPHDIDVVGKVKSCIVGDQVHWFITKIANKEHILDARLSHLWAHHFSIFSGLQLRASDGIDKFVHNILKYSPQLLLLRVLDLEGTDCFDKKHYLKDICNNALLLKYLSLRGTNVTHLPSEINNLSELEVLDIRRTKVSEHATRDVLLLKLRYFLADRIGPSSTMTGKSLYSAVQIPHKIRKMENLEVLSNVKASWDGHELKDIRNLWQLRKLGVVIEDRDNHLNNLFRAISDLKECLQSLSVTISSNTKTKKTSANIERQLEDKYTGLKQTRKHLESLSIKGVTQTKLQLLECLAKGSDELAMVTLSGTLLKQENLMVLAVLPKLCCVRLRSNAYSGSKLTFWKEEFPHLKYFLVEGTNKTKTDIKFEDGATVELEKIVLSFTSIRSLYGIDNLPELKELELEGNEFLLSFSQDGAAHPEPKYESIAVDENTESRVPKQNTQSRALEETIKSRFTFKKEKFQRLKYFCVKDSKVTDITFEDGAAPELNKISLSLTDENSQLTGVELLPKLKEIELRGGKFLLRLFGNANQVVKVTLSDTNLKQVDMKILSKKPNLRCLVLSDNSYDECKLTFNEDEFPKLDLLIVECPKINKIFFATGSAPNLERIVWSFKDMESLSGIGNIQKLKGIECHGDHVPHQVINDIKAHKGQPVLTHKKQQHRQAKEISTLEDKDDDGTRFPLISCFLMKNKNRLAG